MDNVVPFPGVVVVLVTLEPPGYSIVQVLAQLLGPAFPLQVTICPLQTVSAGQTVRVGGAGGRTQVQVCFGWHAMPTIAMVPVIVKVWPRCELVRLDEDMK